MFSIYNMTNLLVPFAISTAAVCYDCNYHTFSFKKFTLQEPRNGFLKCMLTNNLFVQMLDMSWGL